MLSTRTRIATVAVCAAAALVPALGAQAAVASVPDGLHFERLELCHPKWILAPDTRSISEQAGDGGGSIGRFDVENQTSDGSDPYGYDTVAHDDLSYDGC